MEELFRIVDTMALFQGIILGILLLFIRNNNRRSIFLGLFLLSYSLEFIPSLIYQYKPDAPIYYNLLPCYFYLLNAPVLYIYINKLCGTVSKKTVLIILVSAAIEFLVFIIIFISAQQGFLSAEQQSAIIGNLSIYQLLALIYSSVFLLLSAKVLLAYRAKASNYYSQLDGKILKWLFHLVSFLLIYYAILLIVNISASFVDINLYYFEVIMSFINVFFIYWLALSGYKQSQKKMIIITTKENEPVITKSDSSILFAAIIKYFENEKPYHNPDFNIQLLAIALNSSYKKLSKAINDSANENFNTFINKFRIDEVKRMLDGEEYAHFSIEAIGYEAGFNSKASFYNAFKKFTNTTPTNYRKK